MGERYLNAKLKKAIEEKWPLFWGFEEYRKYYHGLTLRARTGHAETGKVYAHIVFATSSLAGAEEIKSILEGQGIAADRGWREAVRRFEEHKSRWDQRYERG